METEIPVFIPRYPLSTRLAICIPSVLFPAMLCRVATSAERFPVLFWLMALATGLFISLIPFFIIREIRFADEMVVRRHFLPDRYVSSREFEGFEDDSIRAGGQRMRVGRIENPNEFTEKAKRWAAARILKGSNPAKPKIETFYFQRGYGTYASFWSLIFSVIMMMMASGRPEIDPRLVMGGTFLLVYYLYSRLLPGYL